MPFTPEPLALISLKDVVKVDEIDYTADFDNLLSRMDNFDKFFKTGKISYNMLNIYQVWQKQLIRASFKKQK